VVDILWLDGKDLRFRPLLERKRILRSIVPKPPSVLLYADHVEQRGIDFFRRVCELDLEGIVAKRKAGVYGESWFKIRNPVYSQYAGRRELFYHRDVSPWAWSLSVAVGLGTRNAMTRKYPVMSHYRHLSSLVDIAI
jgi:hypothetical protein